MLLWTLIEFQVKFCFLVKTYISVFKMISFCLKVVLNYRSKFMARPVFQKKQKSVDKTNPFFSQICLSKLFTSKGFQRNTKIQAKLGEIHKGSPLISGTIWSSLFPCPQVPTFGWPSSSLCPYRHTDDQNQDKNTQKHQHYLQINRLLLAFIIPYAWSLLGISHTTLWYFAILKPIL